MIKHLRLVGALATLALSALAVGVAPVGAGTTGAMAAYECGVFDGLASLTGGEALARDGGGRREPSLDEPVAKLGDVGLDPIPGFDVTIPVYFHVIAPTADSPANVTQAQIDAQIAALNLAFSGFYDNDGDSIDSGFTFELVEVTRTIDPEWYEAPIGSHVEREMKRALNEGGLGALNYYSSTAEDYLGWAYFPGLTRPREYLDGVVVDWESMPGTSTRYAGAYDLGFTAVHEVGHWLGLDHTFYRGCSAKGDEVQDTEPMKEPTNGCPEGKDTCPNDAGLDPIHNFMDYSYDACYFEFTTGQVARMHAHWVAFRDGG